MAYHTSQHCFRVITKLPHTTSLFTVKTPFTPPQHFMARSISLVHGAASLLLPLNAHRSAYWHVWEEFLFWVIKLISCQNYLDAGIPFTHLYGKHTNSPRQLTVILYLSSLCLFSLLTPILNTTLKYLLVSRYQLLSSLHVLQVFFSNLFIQHVTFSS